MCGGGRGNLQRRIAGYGQTVLNLTLWGAYSTAKAFVAVDTAPLLALSVIAILSSMLASISVYLFSRLYSGGGVGGWG